MVECFVAEVIQGGRITIPLPIREVQGITEGAKVRVTIELITEAKA